METIVIGVGDDPIVRIQEALAGGRVASLQIVAHGEAGSLTLGRDRLTVASLEGATADAVAAWKSSFTEDADILLLGCDIGQGGAGAAFMLSATAETAWQHLLAPPTIGSPAGGDTITVSDDEASRARSPSPRPSR